MSFSRYRISFEDAIEEFSASPTLAKRLKSGRYLYVDSCFCLNLPQYIQRNETGVAEMTEYAREHLDECCLLFFVTVTGGWASSDNTSLGFMTQPTVSKPRYLDSEERIKEQIARFKKVRADTKNVADSLTPNLSKTVKALMKMRKMTVARLAEVADMNEKTIQRLRQDPPEREASLEHIVQFCIGLHLPPTLSGRVLSAAGRTFNDTDLHIAYQMLLSSCYEYSIAECNILLNGLGLPLLGSGTMTL